MQDRGYGYLLLICKHGTLIASEQGHIQAHNSTSQLGATEYVAQEHIVVQAPDTVAASGLELVHVL